MEFLEKCWNAVKGFFNTCVEYVKANPLHGIIAGALVAFILVVLIVIISLSAKRSKAKKRLAKANTETQKASEKKPTQTAKPTAQELREAELKAAAEERARKAEEEKAKQEAARKEVEAKLEAQRLEAEREEAELLAAQQAKEKAEAEEKAKAEAEAKAKAEAEEKAKEQEKAKKEIPTPAPVKKTEPKTKSEKPLKKNGVLYDDLKDAEEEDKAFYDENETDKAARYKGKWLICRVLTEDASEDEMYFFELHASNGEKLLSSEEYTSYSGALRGIATHKTNIEKGNFKITLSKKGDYIFKLLSGKNMLLCMGENYPTRARCESAIESTKRFAATAVIDENVQDHVIKVPVEDGNDEIAVTTGSGKGKWIVYGSKGADGEDLYYFELVANNGEKLLSSEEYTTYVGAVNGIGTHKTNIEKGNFRISLTKRGDYIYKLLNGNGQLLCLGEHYKTKRLCQNAVESVKRFAKNSPLLTDAKTTK